MWTPQQHLATTAINVAVSIRIPSTNQAVVGTEGTVSMTLVEYNSTIESITDDVTFSLVPAVVNPGMRD